MNERTPEYPYDEELANQADRAGWLDLYDTGAVPVEEYDGDLFVTLGEASGFTALRFPVSVLDARNNHQDLSTWVIEERVAAFALYAHPGDGARLLAPCHTRIRVISEVEEVMEFKFFRNAENPTLTKKRFEQQYVKATILPDGTLVPLPSEVGEAQSGVPGTSEALAIRCRSCLPASRKRSPSRSSRWSRTACSISTPRGTRPSPTSPGPAR